MINGKRIILKPRESSFEAMAVTKVEATDTN